MPLPWSSQLAAEIRRDRQELLVAFAELRARLLNVPPEEFADTERGRAKALAATEHDYVAIVSAGAEAVELERELEAADRQATQREFDAAAVVIRQMLELVEAVASRLPPPQATS